MPQDLPVTTANEIPDGQIVKVLGVAEGLVVRAVNFGDRVTGILSGLGGGTVEQFERVCTDARREAYVRMVEDAGRMKADAIIGMRYDSVEIGKFLSEVLAYGTAVRVVWNAKHVPPPIRR